MTRQEHQKIDASIPKCRCGNNLSKRRQEEGIDCCPACDELLCQNCNMSIDVKFIYCPYCGEDKK